VTGASHIRKGLPCQDKVAARRRRGVLAVALADGAGSRTHAEVGAQVAANAACAELVDNFAALIRSEHDVIAHSVIGRVKSALEHRANQDGVAVGELASTLAFVAVRRRRFLAGRVGDSVVAALGSRGGALVIDPERGEFANQTYFANGQKAVAHTEIRTGKLADAHSFMLMSDGAAELLVHEPTGTLAEPAVMIGQWLLEYEPSAISAKLDDLLTRKFVPATVDDCAIALGTYIPSPRWLRSRATPNETLLHMTPTSHALETTMRRDS
jgi:hypothetical protein